MSLLEDVRAGCAWVAGRSRSVRIAGDPAMYALETFGATSLAVPPVDWDATTHFTGAEDATIAYVITLDAVNFGSGYFPYLVKRPGLSGYFTIASSLKDRFDQEGPLDARELRGLDAVATSRLFGQPAGDPVRDELMNHFAKALVDLGRYLEETHGGSFVRLLDSAGGSAERLAASLAAMPYFRDVAIYDGREIALLKRAQITPSDMALALRGQPRGEFDDLERLTIFADNLVPHVLRLDGLLEYSAPLAARLERGEPLPAGSAEEVEIRAVSLHAVELMVRALEGEAIPATARDLDLLLWNRGQESRYRGGSKHRTRTVYY